MTADRLFIPPAEDDAAVHADQARDHLTQKVRKGVNDYWPTTPSWELADHFQQAIQTDAAAAIGHALIAVHIDLARIAQALEMVAKIPAAIDLLTSHVTAESALLQAELRDTRTEVVDLRSSVEAGGDPIATAIGSVVAAVDGLARALEPQPRWWQFGLRRRQQPAVDVTASQEDPWEVQPDGH